MQLALIRPIFRTAYQSRAHRIFPHVGPFFGIMPSGPDLRIPKIRQPYFLFPPHGSGPGDQSLPIFHPRTKRGGRRRTGRGKQMDMVRHNHVATDPPESRLDPRLPQGLVDLIRIENRQTHLRRSRQEYDVGTSLYFHYFVARRTGTLWAEFHKLLDNSIAIHGKPKGRAAKGRAAVPSRRVAVMTIQDAGDSSAARRLHRGVSGCPGVSRRLGTTALPNALRRLAVRHSYWDVSRSAARIHPISMSWSREGGCPQPPRCGNDDPGRRGFLGGAAIAPGCFGLPGVSRRLGTTALPIAVCARRDNAPMI